MAEWQPISTAPAGNYDDAPRILLWVEDAQKGIQIRFGCVYCISGNRYVNADGLGGNHKWKITHWMPLPEPPKGNE